MGVAIASGSPNELMGTLEKRQLVIQVDPGIAALGQDGSGFAAVDVRKQQIQFSLVAAFALNCEGFAVGQPIHTGKINILIGAQIHPFDHAGLDVDDSQFDQHVGSAGGGIALRESRYIVGGDLESIGYLDVVFISNCNGNVPSGGRPPRPVVAFQFALITV